MSGTRRWKSARRSEPDRWLDEMGLYRKHMARDASCLFRAVSENVYNTQRYFNAVRAQCVSFMSTNRSLFEGLMQCPIETYLKEMSNPTEWGGVNEIIAMSHIYRCNFVLLAADKDLTANRTDIRNGYARDIYLFHIEDTKHFDAVYTKEYINASAFCQSITYEVLYDGVFQLKDLPYAIDKMLYNKSDHIEYFMSDSIERRKRRESKEMSERKVNKCRHQVKNIENLSNFRSLNFFMLNKKLGQLQTLCDTCLNLNSAKDLIDNDITPFPYKVAKALDPGIYRNIEFDVWSEMRREIRYGSRYGDGHTLQVGVKCLCRIHPGQPGPYHCHIQEMRTDGPCLVFVEELGEKTYVNYEQLEPLPLEQVRPWAPPYRRAHSHYMSVSLMLQQLGNITHKHNVNKLNHKVKASCDDTDKLSVNTKHSNSKLHWGTDEHFSVEFEKKGCDEYCCDMNCRQYYVNQIDLAAYHHMDYYTFQPYPVEVTALPLMVDLRPTTGAPAQPPLADQQAPPLPNATENQPAQGGQVGEMGGHQIATPASVRASTPANGGGLATYTGGMTGGFGCPMPQYMMYGGGGGGGVKGGVMFCAPPPAAPLQHMPPPPNINLHVHKSLQTNGADLPMNDVSTLRYFFNLGVECMWVHGAGCAPPAPPLQALPPPRHYSPDALAQDMQHSLSVQDRVTPAPPAPTAPIAPSAATHNGDNKPKTSGLNNKGNGQRPPVGPRFKRASNDSYNNKHNNLSHNNKGSMNNNNNRRYSQPENRGYNNPMMGGGMNMGNEAECGPADPGLMPVPYLPYHPPPFYTHYYPVAHDPGMHGVMGDVGGYLPYMGEEMPEPYPLYYPPAPQYLPQLPPPAHHPHHPPVQPHAEHK